jgi:hypothetical protein
MVLEQLEHGFSPEKSGDLGIKIWDSSHLVQPPGM